MVKVWSTLLSEEILAIGRAEGTAIFDPAQSSTFQDVPGSKWRIRYGDQSSAGGKVGTDNVLIGNVLVKNQTIELADRMSDSLVQQNGTHGLLGLAFSPLNTVVPIPANTPLDNMIAQKDIPVDQSLFTVYLGSYKDVNDPDKGESFYTFGGIDESVVQATGQEITYVPVDNTRGFWEVNNPSFVVNGHLYGIGGNTAIMDTGTTLMLVSDQVCGAIYNSIPGAIYSRDHQGWLIPRSVTLEQLPELSFALGETQFVIEKEHILYGTAKQTDNGMVYGGIQSRGSLPFDIWGDTFFKCVYAVSEPFETHSFHADGFRSLMPAKCSLVPFNASTRPRQHKLEPCCSHVTGSIKDM